MSSEDSPAASSTNQPNGPTSGANPSPSPSPAPSSATPVRIGVLALQGSFREHMTLLQRVPGVTTCEVRTKEELDSVSGLIIPGGESTTMALVAERWGLIPVLQAFAAARKPIWGTCAGMIFLAEAAEGQKKGGQALLGGLDIKVSRNFFGAQVNSFETQIPAPQCLTSFGGDDTFRALFIRAPAVLEAGKGVQVLASYKLSPEEATATGREEVAVAVRNDVLLATAFHPELTTDSRWHQLFAEMVRAHLDTSASTPAASTPTAASETAPATAAAMAPAATAVVGAGQSTAARLLGRAPNRPNDLPIFGKEHMSTQATAA